MIVKEKKDDGKCYSIRGLSGGYEVREKHDPQTTSSIQEESNHGVCRNCGETVKMKPGDMKPGRL